jgi:putative membrane-bound dehydrogenase-like protein
MRRLTTTLSLLVLSAGLALGAPKVLVSSDSAETGAGLAKFLTGQGLTAAATTEVLSPAALAKAEVLILHRSKMEALPAESRAAIEAFAKRGGGLIALHGGVAAGESAWLKPILGGAWTPESRRFTSRMMLYIATDLDPIIRGASPFDVTDETFYDLEREAKIQVLASAFTPKLSDKPEDRRAPQDPNKANIYDIQPQIWTFENTLDGGVAHRAMAILQGGAETLNHASVRALLLRGIAWATRSENIDAFLPKSAAHDLRYPLGGPRVAEETVKQLVVEPGFEVSVVATEPLVSKPIAVQWDGGGRLWVAESPEYPNGRRERVAPAWRETVLDPDNFERPAKDQISVLSEPDKNGKFTKKTVFHEGLELVRGFCLYRDGVLALHEPDLIWIRDTDGDGKSDKVETIFNGFGAGDSHFVANHLVAAPDGWIYGSLGGTAEPRRPGSDVAVRLGPGAFRFRPDGSAIEQVASKGGNGFGLDVTTDGEVFFGQATTGNPVHHVAVPERVMALGKAGSQGGAHTVIEQRKIAGYQPTDRAALMQIDVVGGYSAACSSLIYEGGAWPEKWNRSIFATEPLVNIVHREALVAEGSSFTGKMENTTAEFIHSPDDYWFRPIEVTCGPDGAVYLLDFYVPVVAHNDTRGPLHSRSGASVRPDRGHYFGRIYRVQAKEATKLTVPNLAKADAAGRVAGLSHPNRIVAFNALNLLVEQGGAGVIAALEPVAAKSPVGKARVLALWGLHRLGALKPGLLVAALKDASAEVRKGAALVAEDGGADASAQAAIATGLDDPDPRAKIAMLRALANSKLTRDGAAAIVAVYPKLTDQYAQGAAVAAAASDRAGVLGAALDAPNSAELAGLVDGIAEIMVENRDADGFAVLLDALALKPAAADPLKVLLLSRAAQVAERPQAAIADATFKSLLASPNPQIRQAVLPLVVSWSTSEALKPVVTTLAGELLKELDKSDASVEERIRTLECLMRARALRPDILPAIGRVLANEAAPEPLRRAALDALRRSDDPAAGPMLVSAFSTLGLDFRIAAFDTLLTRVEWLADFLTAAEGQKVDLTQLGPNDISRLRGHPSPEIAKRATTLLDAIHKPNADKEALIAKLLPEITKPANVAAGKELFAQACATCHLLNGAGAKVGPALDGIGSHGPAQLLVSILDPNRQIDAGYELVNIETHDGTFHAGMLVQQNEARVVVRSMAGDTEVAVNTIKSRTNTKRSLMPEGFEGLGADKLRDIIAYVVGGDSRYRVVDMTRAFTADARRGLYLSQDAVQDSMQFARYGMVPVAGIPFNIVNPESNKFGGNVILLRGGPREAFSYQMPVHAEVPVGHAAKAFHFLGGVAGWGSTKDDPDGKPIMKLTFVFADGTKEEKILHDGVEFADHIARFDVAGSKYAEGVVTASQQVRWFSVPLQKPGVVEKILIDGYANGPAPTTVAITAELP